MPRTPFSLVLHGGHQRVRVTVVTVVTGECKGLLHGFPWPMLVTAVVLAHISIVLFSYTLRFLSILGQYLDDKRNS